jgi:hypothetical protein
MRTPPARNEGSEGSGLVAFEMKETTVEEEDDEVGEDEVRGHKATTQLKK